MRLRRFPIRVRVIGLVLLASALAIIETDSEAWTDTLSDSPAGPASLHALATSKGKFFGTNMGRFDWIFADTVPTVRTTGGYPQYTALTKKQTGWLELNEFAYQNLGPTGRSPTTDAYVRWAHANGKKVLGVELFWPRSPSAQGSLFNGVTTRAAAIATIDAHVKRVMQQYGEKVHKPELYVDMWGIWNEGVSHGNRPWIPTELQPVSKTNWNFRGDGIGGNWTHFPFTAMGEDWVVIVAKAVQKYNPGVPMMFNDFAYELTFLPEIVGPISGGRPTVTPTNANNSQWGYVLKIYKMLKDAGVNPLPVLGVQTHIPYQWDGKAFMALFNWGYYKYFLDQLHAMNVNVIITEFGVMRLKGSPLPTDAQQAALVNVFLPRVLAHPAVIGMHTWGMADPYAWGIISPSGAPGNPSVNNDNVQMEFLAFANARGKEKLYTTSLRNAISALPSPQ